MFTAMRYGWQPKFAHTYSYGGLQITNSYQIPYNGRLYKTFFYVFFVRDECRKIIVMNCCV